MFLAPSKRKVRKAKISKTASTIKQAKHYLGEYLKSIQHIVASNPKEVLEAWNKIFGTKYNGMSQAVGFKDNILLVKVYNSSLYASLKQTSQSSLISQLHQALPNVKVKGIQFLLG